jgi:glucosamine-phosphate N-acetyltransferase
MYPIRKLELFDKNSFLDLVNTFRPVEINVSYDFFYKIYDNIFKNNKIFIAEDRGIIVGSITLLIEQKIIHNFSIYVHIEDLIVRPEYQNKKIGSNLLTYAIEYCRTIGAKKIILNCSNNLINFYKKKGFIEDKIQMSKTLLVYSI